MFRRPLARAGRPGLLGTMARTAVVAGTATAVSGSVARRKQERAVEGQQAEAYREQQADPPPESPPASAPAPTSAPSGDSTEGLISQLRELGELRSSGVLTEEEFAAQKARLLNS